MNLLFETISIVGLGYIGLPTAAVFASRKVKVIGVDVNQHAVDTINRGQIHIVEPDLDMVVHAAVSEGYLRATTRPEPADAFLVAVPTPFKDGPTGPAGVQHLHPSVRPNGGGAGHTSPAHHRHTRRPAGGPARPRRTGERRGGRPGRAKLPQATLHRRVARPWGWYGSIDMGERFQVKRIGVKPGASLSLQKHHHRAQHWIVEQGTAEVTNSSKVFLLSENQSTYIPIGEVHRLHNPGKLELEMIEVQSGGYLGEDDIVRLEDTYGRTQK